MSYSRWITSTWYTFWTSFSGDTKGSQCLEIMYNIEDSYWFSYEEFKTDLENILDIIQFDTKTTREEIDELRGYIERFLQDVDNEYNPIWKFKQYFRKLWCRFKYRKRLNKLKQKRNNEK